MPDATSDIFSTECRRGFKDNIMIELQYTRFENKAIQCCNWMMTELKNGETRMKTLLDDLFNRRIVAMKAREPFILSALDERIKQEGTYLYSNLYASYGLCLGLVGALEKWGM